MTVQGWERHTLLRTSNQSEGPLRLLIEGFLLRSSGNDGVGMFLSTLIINIGTPSLSWLYFVGRLGDHLDAAFKATGVVGVLEAASGLHSSHSTTRRQIRGTQ